MRASLAVMLIGATAFAAPVPKEAKKTPLDQLQGKWVLVSFDSGGGTQTPTGDFSSYTLTVDRGIISTASALATAYPPVPAKFDFKSDPMKMDMPFGGDKVIPGIIKIDGDRLDWCVAPAGSTRPTEFGGGDSRQHYIWKRVGK